MSKTLLASFFSNPQALKDFWYLGKHWEKQHSKSCGHLFEKEDKMQSEREEQEMEEKKTEEVFTLVSTFILTPHTHTHKPENTSQIYKHKPGAQPLVAW